MSAFSDELRNLAGDQWDRIIGHRFTVELAKGEVGNEGERVWYVMGVSRCQYILTHKFLCMQNANKCLKST